MLAEYLGEDQMLALVCRSFRAACALEEYEQNGEVNCTLGLHGKAAERGKSIVGRFLVICLEDMRCYIQCPGCNLKSFVVTVNMNFLPKLSEIFMKKKCCMP